MVVLNTALCIILLLSVTVGSNVKFSSSAANEGGRLHNSRSDCGPDAFPTVNDFMTNALNFACGGSACSFFFFPCPNYDMNECCVEHDDCYRNYGGQFNCDSRLCGCLPKAVKADLNFLEKLSCHSTIAGACTAVVVGGGFFYESRPHSRKLGVYSRGQLLPAFHFVEPGSESFCPAAGAAAGIFEYSHHICAHSEDELKECCADVSFCQNSLECMLESIECLRKKIGTKSHSESRLCRFYMDYIHRMSSSQSSLGNSSLVH